MWTNQNEVQIGEKIRRARRERDMTQTQLGGIRYSKSYISAIEHAKIIPSEKVLEFIASQLQLPDTYFTSSGERNGEVPPPDIPVEELLPHDKRERVMADEFWPLLDILVEQIPRRDGLAFEGLPPFSIEALEAVPASRRASYAFLLGTMAQQKEDFSLALRAFEYALQHSSPQHRLAILDALGNTYALQHLDSLALHYHLQAHLLLKQQEKDIDSSSPLHLNIALHCAHDYRALGIYQQAGAMYEDARLHLNAWNSMENAAEIYLGLGYCVYGMVCQVATSGTAQKERASIEEMNQSYRRAFNLLQDSVSLSLLVGNRRTEFAARLLLCMGALDWCARLRRKNSSEGGDISLGTEARCASLLDEGEAHCQQLLLACQEDLFREDLIAEEVKQSIYPVLASVVRIAIQRAAIARTRGHAKTVSRELALASSLCNQTLSDLFKASLPALSVETALAWRTANEMTVAPALPTLPDKAPLTTAFRAIDKVEVYLAAGEVAEELGRAAEHSNDTARCYERADHFYLAALEHASSVITRREHDAGYLTRCYQRCISLLEERVAGVQDVRKESACELLQFFKSELQRLPELALSVDRHRG